MAADQERADRIRALKQERPDLTWRRIADHVGVTERSATDWQKKGGIEYDNAKKLAEIFEVDVDYIWRGIESGTPSPFAGQDGVADALAQVLDRLGSLEDRLGRLEDRLEEVVGQRGKQTADIIERLEEVQEGVHVGLDQLERALSRNAAAEAGRIVQGIEEAWKSGKLPALPPASPTTAATTAPKRTRRASKPNPA